MRGSRDKLSRPRAVRGTVVALILVWLVSVCASASAAPRGDCNGQVAFDSVREGDRDIYAIDAPPGGEGSPAPNISPTQLTGKPGPDASDPPEAKPSWSPPLVPEIPPIGCSSPEARLIAFQRTSGGSTDIWTLDVAFPEGTVGAPLDSINRVIDDGAAPAWAPFNFSGIPVPTPASFKYPPIAFERNVHGERDIFVANYDGSDESNVTESADVDEANPDWSAGAEHLAFNSDRGGRREVWVMDLRYNPTSEEPYEPIVTRKVTEGPGGFSVNPSWFTFTNGNNFNDLVDSIAFAGADGDGGDRQIHYLESRRVGLPFAQIDLPVNFTLTTNPSDDTAPAWSPSGDRIAYQSNRDRSSDIFVMDPLGEEGTDLNLTQSVGENANPDWQGIGFRGDATFPVRPRGRRARPRGRVGRGVVGEPPVRVRPQGGPKCRKTGTPRNDLLCGTPRRDVLRGKGGDDRILGRGGNDKLLGGAGNDRIKGGSGNDKIRGGAGADRLNGGSGRDDIGGGVGGDRIKARDGQRDRISGGPGDDRGRVDSRERRIGGVETLHR